MSILQRIKRIEAVILAKRLEDETYPITLEQWRRYADGEDILPEIEAARRAAFLEWREKAEIRQRQAERVSAMFRD